MNELALPDAIELNPAAFPRAARPALRLLENLHYGQLAVTFPDGQRALFGGTNEYDRADIRLLNWRPVRAALRSGDIGFAETWIAGDWTTSDLPRLLALFVRNRDHVEDVIYGTLLGRIVHRLRHLLNRNSRTQARRNIHAHYDLGNDFYRLWLGPSMTYSSALFAWDDAAGDDAELEHAHQAKYNRVLNELALPAHSRVLEIGCGWGGFAAVAARAGHSVTGLTLSQQQLSHGRAKLESESLRAELRLQDYRDEHGSYDGIASIEMFEAVGEAYWPTYFATLRRCLAPGARACVQTITINDRLFERYRVGSDFIQQYIFPGGMLPSPTAFRRQAEDAGLAVVSQHAFGPDYSRTLAVWRTRFQSQLANVQALGFDERFIRTWNFYLSYCEAAFSSGNTDVMQFTLVAR